MHSHIQTCMDFNLSVFTATETALGEYTKEENLQFPKLVSMVAKRLSMDVLAIAEIDPIVRRYVRTHPEWRVSRGAQGGIMRLSVWQKKQGAKADLEAAKKAVLAQVEAKTKGVQPAPSTLTLAAVEDSSTDSEASE